MKIITIEEHISGVPINRYLGKYLPEAPSFMAYASVKGRPYQPDMELYCDMDKCRIADMDKHGITIKFIPKETFQKCREEAEGMWADGKPKKWYYAIPIIVSWLLIAWLILKAVS